jgi:hypothetical protein
MTEAYIRRETDTCDVYNNEYIMLYVGEVGENNIPIHEHELRA